MYVIDAQNVYKNINKQEIIKDLTLQVKKEDIFVLLGPNGAGKSTTIKLLNGILSADKGNIKVFDQIGINEKTRERIGILSDSTLLYNHLTAEENILFFAELYGMDKTKIQKRMNELLDRLNLSNAKNQKIQTYSTGMKKRIQLIKAVIHNPDLIFLDEPTSGLDPESTQEVNDFIEYLNKEEKKTLFICSHHLDEVEVLGNEFGFLSNGTLFAQDSLQNLKAELSSKIILKTSLFDNIPSSITPYVENYNNSEGHIECSYKSEKNFAFIINEIIKHNISIFDLEKSTSTLRDVYFKLLEESKNALE